MISAAPRTPGVYSITCAATGRTYIGSSGNLRKRLSEHLRRLRSGTHWVRAMQADYRNHGLDSFSVAHEGVEFSLIRLVEDARIRQAVESGCAYNTQQVRKLLPRAEHEPKVGVTINLRPDLHSWLVATAAAENRNLRNYLVSLLQDIRGAAQ